MVEKIADAKFFDSLVEQMVEKGAYKAAVIPVSQVELDRSEERRVGKECM